MRLKRSSDTRRATRAGSRVTESTHMLDAHACADANRLIPGETGDIYARTIDHENETLRYGSFSASSLEWPAAIPMAFALTPLKTKGIDPDETSPRCAYRPCSRF